MSPEPQLIERFKRDLDPLLDTGGTLGIAVSGGADSVALLLLAAAARPGLVEAVTVDHRLQTQSAAEARRVAELCGKLAVPHSTLTVSWRQPPSSNLQAQAREARYALLAKWAEERRLTGLATAHHRDDQAETLLMRLARGSGVGGLAGIQPARPLNEGVLLVRPLLGWRREDLRRIVVDAGIQPVDDPTNSDDRFDRSRARALLGTTEWLTAERLASVASNAADAEQALGWAARREFAARCSRAGATITIDASDLPRELRRRLLVAAVEQLMGEAPPGPQVMAALDTLDHGGTTTLAGLKLEGGPIWRLSPAPPRRSR
jgi:tRNA(Ile)-lysidine synthase